jgi:signal transduction histidine kinase
VSWALLCLGWVGWATALSALWTQHRRMGRVADAEHELRGAATAIGLAGEPTPVVRLELDRMTAALADLAEARGARAAPPADLEAGRLAQVLANVVANAAEHGLGPVEVRARREGPVVQLEVSNQDRRRESGEQKDAGRGQGLVIAQRAARELGGRLTVEREGGRTRVTVRLPSRVTGEGGGGAGDGAGREGGRRAA